MDLSYELAKLTEQDENRKEEKVFCVVLEIQLLNYLPVREYLI